MQISKSSLVILPFVAVVACGPAAGPAQGESDGSEGESGDETDPTDPTDPSMSSDPTVDPSDTDMVPLTCYYEDQEYQSGDEFQTANGCATLRCDAGTIVTIDDSWLVVDGDLDLPTQEDVDALECLYEVTGAVTVSGSVYDLSAFESLYRIGGDLSISGTQAVTLTGVEALGEVGGHLVIADNTQLTAMSFSPFMSVFGDTTIQNNDALQSLAGAGFLGQCNACSRRPHGLDEGEATTGGSEPDPGGDEGGADEPGGGTYYGNILIADNDVLYDISVLANLWYAWADVRFRNNLALDSLTSMSSLQEVRGSLEISGHPALDATGVQTFADAIDVWGERVLCGNGGGAPC